MAEVRKHPEAFSRGRQGMFRRPRVHNKAHLNWITTLPSLLPGTGRVDPAHIRMRDPLCGKASVGMGEKPDDKWVVPLHRSVHDHQHSMNEREFWNVVGINPVLIAALLWAHSGNDEAATIVIRNARSIGRQV